MPLTHDEEDATNINGLLAPPCVACSRPSECEIWLHPLCYPCAIDWQAHAPTYEQIFKKHGPNAKAVDSYTTFTKAWISKRRSEMQMTKGAA